jgi:hypothetical protein
MRHFRLLPLFLALPALAQGAVEGFGESFDGTGPFETVDGNFQGLDAAGWSIEGDGQLESGAYVIENDCECVEGEASDVLSREVVGRGSFRSRVEIRDVDLGDVDIGDPATSLGQIRLSHTFPRDVAGVEFGLMDDVTVQEPGHWLLFAGVGENIETAVVFPGQNISLSVVFDDATSEITFEYDSDIDDGLAGLRLGPLVVQGRIHRPGRHGLPFLRGVRGLPMASLISGTWFPWRRFLATSTVTGRSMSAISIY